MMGRQCKSESDKAGEKTNVSSYEPPTVGDEAVNGKAVEHILSEPFGPVIEELRKQFVDFVQWKQLEGGQKRNLRHLIGKRDDGDQMSEKAQKLIKQCAEEFVAEQFGQVKEQDKKTLTGGGKQTQKAFEHSPESMLQLARLLCVVGDYKNAGESAYGAATMAVEAFAKRVHTESEETEWKVKWDHRRMNLLIACLFAGVEGGKSYAKAWNRAQDCHEAFHRNAMKAKDMLESIDLIQKLVSAVQSMPVDQDVKKRLEYYKEQEMNIREQERKMGNWN